MATFTSVSAQDLERFLETYALELRAFGGIPEGSVNSNYWLEVRGETDPIRIFLRVFEEQDHDGARAEAELLEGLERGGVPTPAPIASAHGERVGTLAGKPAALFPWRAGKMRCQKGVTAQDLSELGRALAKMHRVTVPAGSRARPGRFGPEALERRLETIAKASDASLAALAPVLRDALRTTVSRRRKDLPSGVVHGDLFRDNVLWDDAGCLVAMLDFESAFDGAYAYDLAVCLLSWCYGDGFEVPLARALVDGYSIVRPLDATERDGLFEEARFGALRFTITRITDYAMRTAEGPRVIKDYRRFLARFEQLGHWGAERFDRDLFGDPAP